MSINLQNNSIVYVKEGTAVVNLNDSEARVIMAPTSTLHVCKEAVYQTTLSIKHVPPSAAPGNMVVHRPGNGAMAPIVAGENTLVVANPALANVPHNLHQQNLAGPPINAGLLRQPQLHYQDEDDEMEVQVQQQPQHFPIDEEYDDVPIPMRQPVHLPAQVNPGIGSIVKRALPYAKKILLPVAAGAVVYTTVTSCLADWDQTKPATSALLAAVASTETGQKAIAAGANLVTKVCSGVGTATGKIFKAGAALAGPTADALQWAAPRIKKIGEMMQLFGRDVQKHPVAYTAATLSAGLGYKFLK